MHRVILLGATCRARRAGHDEAAQTLFSRMAVEPDEDRKSLISDVFSALKSEGLFGKLDALQVYRAHTEQAALLDWIDPVRTATNVGMTFSADNELKGGTGAYLRTGFIPADGPNFTLNSGSFGVFVTSARSAGGQQYVGSQTGTTSTTRLVESSSGTGRNLRALVSYGMGSPASVLVGDVLTGFLHAQRISATEIEAYYNALPAGAETNNSNTASTVEMYVGTANNSGSPGSSMNAGFGAFWAGAALTSGEIAALRTIITDYMEAFD